MYKVNEYVVYPAHGVCIVKAATDKGFYAVETLSNKMTVLIPIGKEKELGLRSIGTKNDAIKVAQILLSAFKPQDSYEGSTRHYRMLLEKLKSGDLFQIAEIVRDLQALKIHKDLSFGERKMLDVAKDQLNQELELIKERNI